MYFYRLDLKAELNWDLNSDEWRDLYFECEYKQSNGIIDKQFCYRYIMYPQDWIKYENAKQNGFITYTSYYHTPKEIIRAMCEDYKGVIINTYTNEFIYKH